METAWKNRILAGDQLFSEVPPRILNKVIAAFKKDLKKGKISEDNLQKLVDAEKMTSEEMSQILN